MVNYDTRTRRASEVFPRRGTLWLVLAVALGAAGSATCVEVNGGAAELSWSLRTFEATRSWECDELRIGWIRLAWKAATDSSFLPGMEPDGWQHFRCEDSRGITDFSIPAGQQMLWIVPICAGSGMPAAAGHYETPPPIVRTVSEGTVTTLDALLVVADQLACPAESASRAPGL